MYNITITEDIYGYYSEQYETNGISLTASTGSEALAIARIFIEKGFEVVVGKEKEQEQ